MSSWSNLYKCRIFEYGWSRRKCSTKIFCAWPFWFASSEFKLQVFVLCIKWVDYAIWLHILLIMQHLIFIESLLLSDRFDTKHQTGYVNSGKYDFFFDNFKNLFQIHYQRRKFNLKNLSLKISLSLCLQFENLSFKE